MLDTTSQTMEANRHRIEWRKSPGTGAAEHKGEGRPPRVCTGSTRRGDEKLENCGGAGTLHPDEANLGRPQLMGERQKELFTIAFM